MKLAKLKLLFVAAGLALAMGSNVSNAAITLFSNTLIEDDNIDRLSLDANGDGKLDLGDRLEAGLEPIPEDGVADLRSGATALLAQVRAGIVGR